MKCFFGNSFRRGANGLLVVAKHDYACVVIINWQGAIVFGFLHGRIVFPPLCYLKAYALGTGERALLHVGLTACRARRQCDRFAGGNARLRLLSG